MAALLGLAVAACHEPERIRAVQAQALVDTTQLDFGEVPVGEWAEREVRIRNVGYVPFHAQQALALGGDPSFQVELVDDGDEGVVAPGRDKVVRVRFHPVREVEYRETLSLRTDAHVGTERPIPVRGKGGPARIGLEPKVLDFQTLEVDSERLLELTVTNPTDLPLTLSLEGVDPEPFSTDTLTLPPQSTRQVRARYAPRDEGLPGARDMAARLLVRPCDDCTPQVAELTGRSVPDAFEFTPEPVPFAAIPVHERTDSRTRARNVTWRPVRVQGVTTSDIAFIPTTDPSGAEVPPGGEVELGLTFAARSAGPNMGTLTLAYTSDRARSSTVVLDARGGQPTLAVAPVALDFGELPVGGKRELLLTITNAGTNGDLHFTGARAVGDTGQFSVAPPTRAGAPLAWAGGAWPALSAVGPGAPAGLPIAPGADALQLRVFFEPGAAGAFQATLVLTSDDLFTPERAIVLTGQARESGPCTVATLLPQVLDFGNVPAGTGAVLGFRFANPPEATGECAVKDIFIENDGGGVFRMPGGPITGGVARRDTAFSAMVAFRAPAGAEGAYEGTLRMTVNNPAAPVMRLPLRALAVPSCLVASPNFVDFGAVRFDCSTTPRSTRVSNQCTLPVTVTSTRLGAGTTQEPQYRLLNPVGAPVTLAPGEGLELELEYARAILGQHFTPLFVQAGGEPAPLLVPVLGEANHEGLRLDRFTQGAERQLDVLFVVGNTTTMEAFQARLRSAIPGWAARARAAGVDVRVGVTTTGLVPRGSLCPGGVQGGEAGRLFPVDGSRGRVLSLAAPTFVQALQANLDVGLCHNLPQGLETMRQALSSPLVDRSDDPRTPQPADGNLGLLRPSARLAVVMVTDEDDHSGFGVEGYTQFLQALKGTGRTDRSRLHALLPDGGCTTAAPAARRIAAVARASGGTVGSICQGDYSGFLDRLLAGADGLQPDFPLTAEPTGTEEMTVAVDGVTQGSAAWGFDGERNAVVFNEDAVPRAGSQVLVRYRAVCAPVAASP